MNEGNAKIFQRLLYYLGDEINRCDQNRNGVGLMDACVGSEAPRALRGICRLAFPPPVRPNVSPSQVSVRTEENRGRMNCDLQLAEC